MEYVLQTDALTKRYAQDNVVDEVSMHVKKGSIYGFIGKNGAGKTTFMRMVAGLAAPTAGGMTLFGSGELERARRRIGTLIEEPGAYGGMTARENLEVLRRSFGITEKKRVEEMLAEGLVEEVKALKRMGCHKGMVSMQGLGYKEILAWLEGECTYEQAVEVLKRDTRHFAKRQLTWFRREREVIWVEKNMFDYDDEKILEFMLEKLWERGIVS